MKKQKLTLALSIVLSSLSLVSCGKSELGGDVPVTGVTLDQTALTLDIGESETLVATVSPKNATNKDVVWSTSNKKVATVSDGIVTAESAGEAVITVTTDDGGKKATCAVSVNAAKVPVTGISIKEATLNLTVGDEYQLTADVFPENATDKSIKWTTSNSGAASVTNGLVKAEGVGQATITARTVDGGKESACTVNVKSVTVSATGVASNVTVNSASLSGYANTAGIIGEITIGIICSENSSPSFTNGTIFTSNGIDSDNRYTIEAKGLTPSTKYYYRSFLTNGNLNYYGDVKDFMTAQVLANVTTKDAYEIGATKVTLGGKVELISKEASLKGARIFYGTDGTNLDALKATGKKIDAGSFSEDGSFVCEVNGLSQDTKYYYVAVATVENVEFSGVIRSFMTEKSVSVAVTGEYTDLFANAVTLYGWCNQKEEEGLSAVYGMEYSSTDLTTAAKTAKAESRDSDNKYFCKLSGLSSGTKYYYRAYVLFNGVRTYGEVKTFTTPEIKASVSAESSAVSYHSATISGKLTVESEGSFTKSATLYYSSTASTLDALKSSGAKKTLTLGADGSYSIVADMLTIKTKYYYCVVAKVDDVEFASSVKNLTTLGSRPELVDLGLSVKWASFNLSASKPEEYGGYYQWAGTTDVTDTSIYLGWSNCPYHTGSGYPSGWTKYNTASSYGTVDNKTVLDLEDDVAHVRLGGKWRMPTSKEWAELRNNCTSEWTTLNGVTGIKFTSKNNGNSIFLPAAGYRSDDYLGDVGSGGYYWSSSRDTSPDYAYYLYFRSDRVEASASNRYGGNSVRPVSE